MTAYFIVRATVANPEDRAAFDTWYETEHLPDAIKAFNARSAMRGWSTIDPSLHTAWYRFDTLAAAESATSGAALKALVAEFDRVWGSRVTRTRDIVPIAQDSEA